MITDFINSTQSVELNIQPRALNILLDDSIEMISLDLDKHRIKLIKEFNQTDLLVNVDHTKIVSTFYNLLSNAVGASATEINLKVHEEGDFAVIEIADNGDGISLENQSKIFEPFFTTKQKSLGLGLTNAQKSIINHKGELNLESKEGNGSKFIIKLPITNQTQLWDSFNAP